MTDVFLTRDELARELKIHPTTVDRWRREGMPSELWGPRRGTRRFSLQAALAWARSADTASVGQDQIDRGRVEGDPGDTGGAVSHARPA